MREKIKLIDNWKFVKKAKDTVEAASAKGEEVTLPHTWNAADGQDGGNDYYRGTCYYVRSLPKPEAQGRVYLEVTGAAMTAEVFINHKSMVRHEGGFSTFRVDITEELVEDNTLVISVDNGDNHTVYPQKADFTFYGGLYREVNLIVVPESHFDLDYYGGNGIKVTPVVDLDRKNAVVTVEAWMTKDASKVIFTVDDQTKEVSAADGYAAAEFLLENVRLWDGLRDPWLYTAKAVLAEEDKVVLPGGNNVVLAEGEKAVLPGGNKVVLPGGDNVVLAEGDNVVLAEGDCAILSEGDCVETRFGCRQFEMDPERGFILNGRSCPLRGVSRHQDRKGAGSALSMEMHREDMEIIKEMGANTIRLAHYQHAQEFYDLCDETGMVVWAEIPYITMHMKEGVENTLSQMRELIIQNYNHPSICCWGLSNEITAASAVNEELLENHRQLNDLCHSLDATRKTTMANVFMLEIDSPILEIPDINSYNLYFGWYIGELDQTDSFFDEYHNRYPHRVIGYSEYGADANPAFHSADPQRGDYTEEYQCVYHEHMLRMIEKRPWLWATHVWNMFDFAADGRDEGGRHGENQKGLVTFDRKIKKDAFYLYKSYWSGERFVHLCGGRYVDRTEEVTQIKVYSNEPSVKLYVDGQLLEEKEGGPIFTFQVPISGEHRIVAETGLWSGRNTEETGLRSGRNTAETGLRSGSSTAGAGTLRDEITVRRVKEPNKDYLFVKEGDIVNWFDREELKKDCYSVSDTLGELAENPQANAIVQRLMAQASGSRGDVADSVKDNPALRRMMQRMTLVSLLRQAGDAVTADQIRELNKALQQIRK